VISLKSLSDKALIHQLHQLVHKEQHLTLEVLSHLAEVARRELYLAKGYGSLFDYCVGELGYGESTAWRRVRVARAIKDIPEVYHLMKSGQLTFSAVCQVTRVLTPKNHTRLLPRLAGKSKSEIERIMAEYQLPVPIRDQAKPRITKKEVPVEAPPSGAPSNAARGRSVLKLGEISRHSDGKFDPTVDEEEPPKKVVYEKVYEVRFAGDEELMELMNWMRTHLSHRFPKGATYQEIFKYAMRYVREREDMTKRAERRKRKHKPKPSHSTRERGVPPPVILLSKKKRRCGCATAGNVRTQAPMVEGATQVTIYNTTTIPYPSPAGAPVRPII